MCENDSDKAVERLAGLLGRSRRLLVLTHSRPDGDGLGSMAALCRSAAAAGKTAEALLLDGLPRQYAFLFAGDPPAGPDRFAPLAEQADLLVVLDTAARSQLAAVASGLAACRRKLAVIDHHATTEHLGAVQWIDPSAAATGVMLDELLGALRWPVDLRCAEALMTAAVSDTGWLRFANTDSRCLAAVGRWIEAGVRPDGLYRRLFQNDRPQRLRLIARLLDSLELYCGGRLAVMVLRNRDFEQTAALPEETENLVNEALRIGQVEAALLLVENPEGVRASLRSRQAVNVARLAEAFGGGGHPRAAGIRLSGTIEAWKDRLAAACAEALNQAGPAGGLGHKL